MSGKAMSNISDVAMIRKAHALFAESRYDDAIVFCLDVLKRHPNHYEALGLISELFNAARDHPKAIEYGKRLLKSAPLDGRANAHLARLYNVSGRHKEALNLLEKFLKKSPVNQEVLVSLARTYEFVGDLDKAISLLEPFVSAGTDSPNIAFTYASILFERKENEKALAALLRHAANSSIQPKEAENILFLAGQIHERLGQYDQAFEAYARANALTSTKPNPDVLIERIDSAIETFTANAMKRLPRARNQSRLPVFIICRPRSGSTLVERIIASHPRVHAAGERGSIANLRRELNLKIGSILPYPQCVKDMDQNDVDSIADDYLKELQEIAPDAERITDKGTSSWEMIGLISLLFPNAVLIDLRRDPLDNCLACFTAQLTETHKFMRDLSMIGFHHKQYERMLDHWYTVLDNPILRVNYEDLVADQETWSRKIIEHCGLEWDDRVLRFYEKGAQQSTTANPTLSFQQVRQPIYKSSVSRAKKFEKHLGPLYEALGLPWPPKDEETK